MRARAGARPIVASMRTSMVKLAGLRIVQVTELLSSPNQGFASLAEFHGSLLRFPYNFIELNGTLPSLKVLRPMCDMLRSFESAA